MEQRILSSVNSDKFLTPLYQELKIDIQKLGRVMKQRTLRSENSNKLMTAIHQELDNCIKENPIEYNRYKNCMSDEYFCIIMRSSLDLDTKIDLLEYHLNEYNEQYNPLKPLTW